MNREEAFHSENTQLHQTPAIRELVNQFTGRKDADIWQDFVNGEDEAFVFIYNNYVNRLFRFGIQFAPREMVKDAIQDLFLYLKKRKKTKNSVQSIAPYLYKSLYRIIDTKVAYAKKYKSTDEVIESKNWQINISNEIKLIEQENIEERSQQLKISINELTSKQKQAIVLYYYEGFTHDEIKDVMGLSNKSSVRKLIYRGLDMLQDSLCE